MEIDELGNILTTHIRGNRLISRRSEGVTYFYHFDGLGSVRQLTDDIEEVICFIALAAFGTPLSEEVEILSHFRDEHLLTNTLRQRLVTLYYQYSPTLAEFISERAWAKRLTRIAHSAL